MTSQGSEDSRRLYVGNLSFDLTERELRDAFAVHVGVERIDWMKDKGTGVFRGFAFVMVRTGEEVRTAIENLNGVELGGRAMKVSLAKPKEDRRRGVDDYRRDDKRRLRNEF